MLESMAVVELVRRWASPKSSIRRPKSIIRIRDGIGHPSTKKIPIIRIIRGGYLLGF
jgi:hypothetical protein